MQSTTPATSNKLWNKTFILTMLVSGLSTLSNSMLSPALPIYAGSLGYGTDIAGTIVAIATFLSMFGRGLSGGWSNRMSRKTLLMICLCGSAAAFVLFRFAVNFPLLLAAKCIQGVCSGIIITVLCTIAYDTLPPELMGRGVAMYGLASSLVGCIAPSIGTALAHAGLYNVLFLSSAAAALGSAALLMTIPVRLTEPARAWIEAKKNGTAQRRRFHISDYLCREALPAGFLLLMTGIVYAAVANYLSICGLSRGINSVALFFTINSVTMILFQPVCGKLADSKPISWLVVPGFVLMGVSCLLIAFATNMVFISIAGALFGVGFCTASCAGQLAAIRSVDIDRRSIANSTYYVGGDIGLTLGAYLSGALAAGAGYTVMYLVAGGFSLLTLVFCFIYWARRGRA